MPQTAINDLLVERGRAGLEVVRLKGGDPFVFARGGEEAQALAEAGVPFEVVPGITSAIAAPAYAGVPLTMRHSSTLFTVITGHEDPDKGGEIDWETVARLGGTIVEVGTAMIGEPNMPPSTLGSAPSMPATTITAGERARSSRLPTTRCKPATPASYTRRARRPDMRSVSMASSATGISLVPAVTTLTGSPGDGSIGRVSAVATRATSE
jgi:hypothetical protein